MDKPKTYNEWHSSLEGFEGLRHANCCKISYEAGQQSRQAEVDELNQLYLKAQHQEVRHRTIAQDALALVEEKDKRIEELQAKVDAVEHVLGCAMIAPKEVFQYADRISKALRGEHE